MSNSNKDNECVKVMVRCRPMNSKEMERECQNIIKIDGNANSIQLRNEKEFVFDNVFGENESQETIYNKSAFKLVESVVEGYNGTIFAYGQTGCGKTHTMMGYAQNNKEKGIIPRTFDQIVDIIQQSEGVTNLVRCSFIEIYNEEIHDLLSKDVKEKYELKQAKDNSVYIKDLNMIVVKTVLEMEALMVKGNSRRSVGETLMNKDSSRSHSIFTLYVEQSMIDEKGNERITLGKLNLVDLAGSERLSKTGAQGDRLKEATKINLSLSALGNVISALVDGKSQHIPYRDSKLTRLLQDSLGGNTKTIMIANISPADYNYDETLSTLRYASRAKNIQNKPKVNADPKDALLKEYAEEIQRLKALLNNQKNNPHAHNNHLNNEYNQFNHNHNHDNHHHDHQQLLISNSQQILYQQTLEEQQKQQNIEVQLEMERQEKQKLEQLIATLQQNLVQGGGADESQKQKYQEHKKQLEQQEQEHIKLLEEKKKQEEEYLKQEKTFQNLQEEVDHLKKIIKDLRLKLNGEKDEIKELEKQQVQEKEDLNELLRLQDKELKLLKQIAKQVFKKEELQQLKENSHWSECKENYSVPQFFFREKKTMFPKIKNNNEQQERESNVDIDIKITNTPVDPKKKKKNNIEDYQQKISSIKEDYFDDFDNQDEFQLPMKINKKIHLQPLRNSTNNINLNNNTNNITLPNDKINAKNTRLQPLQQSNQQKGNTKTKQMDINFKATIHINNNGDIYY